MANTFSTGWMTTTCVDCLPRVWSTSPTADPAAYLDAESRHDD
jgi:hypothetical protein